MARICLLAPGQPSVDPRLVKEADALHEVGHEVQVVCAHYIDRADQADRQLLKNRAWWLLLAEGHLNRRRFGAMLGPDRATAGTDGIGRWWSGRQRILVYSGLG
jgi:hypothetical protein